MAMNKRDKQALKDAQDQLTYAKALRWSQPAAKPDVPPPTGDEWVTGFLIIGNGEYARVVEGWSAKDRHGREQKAPVDRFTSYQGPRWLYSTRDRALAVLRNELELIYAKSLAAIDSQL